MTAIDFDILESLVYRVPLWQVAESLGREVHRLRNVPIEQIKQRGMPRQYARSWAEIYASARSEQAAKTSTEENEE